VNINRSDETGRWQAATLDEAVLRQKYVDEKKTMEQVAKEMGISSTAVYNRLKKLGLCRSHREAGLRIYGKDMVLDEEKTRSMYVDSKMSTSKIAAEFGVSGSTIYEIVRKLGIMRSREEALSLGWETNPIDTDLLIKKYVDEGKTCHEVSKEMGIAAFERLKKLDLVRSHRDANFNRWQGQVPDINREQIKEMYLDRKMSYNEIAAELKVSVGVIFREISELGIVRDLSEANKLQWKDRKLQLDESLIRELYLDKKYSAYDIADYFGVSQQAIKSRLDEMGIGRDIFEAAKLKWTKPEFIEKFMAGCDRKPNKKELYVDSLIQFVCPQQFAYNGSFELGVHIGGKIPDWIHINGEKKLVEFNGCYYHACEQCGYGDVGLASMTGEEIRCRDAKRLELFAKYGYETLVIWEHDSDEEIISNIQAYMAMHLRFTDTIGG